MNVRSFASHFVVAVVSAGLGWFGHDLMTIDKLSPGESIAAAWETQLNILTDVQGQYREPSDASMVAETSFSTLSIGLALHYDQLTEQQKRELSPFLDRAKSVQAKVKDQPSLAVLDCIERAGSNKPIDQDCIASAVKPATSG